MVEEDLPTNVKFICVIYTRKPRQVVWTYAYVV